MVIVLGDREIALNADTKRAAVERFVEQSTADPDRAWRVVRNRRGQINKVLPDLGPAALPGWYAYVDPPLAAETLIL